MLKGLVVTTSRNGVWPESLNVICGACPTAELILVSEDRGLDGRGELVLSEE
jgi:hypothetical protein